MLWFSFIGIMTTAIVLSVGGLNFAFERVYGLALIPMLLYNLFTPGNPPIKKSILLWMSWFFVLIISAFYSGNFMGHFAPLLIAVVPICYFTFITADRVDGAVIDQIVRTLLWGFGVLGVIALAASRVVGPDHVPFTLVDQFGRLRLTVIEPNLLGSTFGFLLILSLPRAKLTTSTVVMYALALVTLLGAFSKGPLVAVVIAGLLFGVFRAIARRTGLSIATLLPIWLGGAACLALLTFLPSALGAYNTLLARQDAISARVYVLNLAMARFWESPLIGRGPGDFKLLDPEILRAVGGQDFSQNLWIAQMMVNILHDSGIIGVTLYILFLIMIVRRGFKWVVAGSIDHAGYLAAFLSILISSQSSTVHLSAIFGIAAGLVAAMPLRTRAINVLRSGSAGRGQPFLNERKA